MLQYARPTVYCMIVSVKCSCVRRLQYQPHSIEISALQLVVEGDEMLIIIFQVFERAYLEELPTVTGE